MNKSVIHNHMVLIKLMKSLVDLENYTGKSMSHSEFLADIYRNTASELLLIAALGN